MDGYECGKAKTIDDGLFVRIWLTLSILGGCHCLRLQSLLFNAQSSALLARVILFVAVIHVMLGMRAACLSALAGLGCEVAKDPGPAIVARTRLLHSPRRIVKDSDLPFCSYRAGSRPMRTLSGCEIRAAMCGREPSRSESE